MRFCDRYHTKFISQLEIRPYRLVQSCINDHQRANSSTTPIRPGRIRAGSQQCEGVTVEAFRRRFSLGFARPAVLAGLAIAAVPAQSQDSQPQGEEVET